MLFKIIVNLVLFTLISASVYANDAGSRGAYTRGGWAGARYIANGMSGVVMANDVFSIYWNPAGLSDLKSKKRITEENISRKANEGKIDQITEDDLLIFSENENTSNFISLGASYTQLDIERDAAFTGCAFGLFNGVMGFGLYTIVSSDIETRDSDGNLTGSDSYVGASGFITYSWASDIFSVGISLKPLYEKIAESSYRGLGADFGVQVFPLPFLKVGVMARDLGSFLSPIGSGDSEDEFDFFEPEISSGISIFADSGITISFSTTKRLEQDSFYYGGGAEYELTSNLSVSAGMFDDSFTTGFELQVLNLTVSYALFFDRIDGGYNNTISLEILF